MEGWMFHRHPKLAQRSTTSTVMEAGSAAGQDPTWVVEGHMTMVMKLDRLNTFALLSIEAQLFPDVKYENVVNTFAQKQMLLS